MFAFAIWDEEKQELFCARDRFGIKPFYYTEVDGVLYFASEVKALLPFSKCIETSLEGFKDYLTFQLYLDGKTLFKGIYELVPGFYMTAKDENIRCERYWQVYYDLDFDHTAKYFEERVRELILDSISVHLRSDVPVGAYISGGLDSSIVASVATRQYTGDFIGFTGKFSIGAEFDESEYARDLARWRGFGLQEIDIDVKTSRIIFAK
jgi:asparagine synthase (glutamine-hydrolysing)